MTLEKSKENEFSLPNIIQTRVDSKEVRRKVCFGPDSENFSLAEFHEINRYKVPVIIEIK